MCRPLCGIIDVLLANGHEAVVHRGKTVTVHPHDIATRVVQILERLQLTVRTCVMHRRSAFVIQLVQLVLVILRRWLMSPSRAAIQAQGIMEVIFFSRVDSHL